MAQDFMKSTAVVQYGPKAFDKWASTAAQLARLEGFTGHARSLELRLGIDEK
jgi:histidinol dehydrogenase